MFDLCIRHKFNKIKSCWISCYLKGPDVRAVTERKVLFHQQHESLSNTR